MTKALKRKKPAFQRQDAHKKKRLSPSWRKPKGSDSKMRVGKKGYRGLVKVGWGAAAALRGLNKDGKTEILVSSSQQLASLDPKKNAVVVSAVVGLKKKIEILSGAIKLNLDVSNVKDPQKFITDSEAKRRSAQADRTEKSKQREQAREADKKAAEKKESEEKKADKKEEKQDKTVEALKNVADEKAKEKKELDKTLITKK